MLVPASTTLRELHDILQVAMGWEGIPLFSVDAEGGAVLYIANGDLFEEMDGTFSLVADFCIDHNSQAVPDSLLPV